MATKILEQGLRIFHAICSKCTTKFSYELEDIKSNWIKCPSCTDRCYHSPTKLGINEG